ncbi:MAG: 2-C-methyl-D-erythritol 4-phosphate cytidylyltransferase [Candidatus Hydrogenedentes bacterium]|nr:2-C-methyl-D-erythritol 4-phosphate cytidylyltransferase [Candidatus Hydrogenedentota bacterium]
MNTQLIIPAGGFGTRLGRGIPKALVTIGKKPIIYWTLKKLLKIRWSFPPIIVTPQNYENTFKNALNSHFQNINFLIIEGGHERQHSVYNGLRYLHPETEIVVIHDCARPFVPLRCVEESIEKAKEIGSATVAIPVTDTILEVDEKMYLKSTPNRKILYKCQTPQSFKKQIIVNSHEKAKQQNLLFTDDASLVHYMGNPVAIVFGDPINIKITLPYDIAISEYLLGIENSDHN